MKRFFNRIAAYTFTMGLSFLLLFVAKYLLSLVGIITFDSYWLIWMILGGALVVLALPIWGVVWLTGYASPQQRWMRRVVRASEAALACKRERVTWDNVFFGDTQLHVIYHQDDHLLCFACTLVFLPPEGGSQWFDHEMEVAKRRLAEVAPVLHLDEVEHEGVLGSFCVKVEKEALSLKMITEVCHLIKDIQQRAWKGYYYVHDTTDEGDFYAELNFGITRSVICLNTGETVRTRNWVSDDMCERLPESMNCLLAITVFDIEQDMLISRDDFERLLPLSPESSSVPSEEAG